MRQKIDEARSMENLRKSHQTWKVRLTEEGSGG